MTCKPLALALLPVLAAGGAAAWDGIMLQAITASVDFELYVDSSPTPVCWHYWTWDAEGQDVPTLHQTYGTDVEPCTSEWLLHCDSDSLSWHGSWAEIDPDNDLWNRLRYDVELNSRVYIWEPARLLARRAVTGNLSTDIHALEVVPLVGDPVVMLAGRWRPRRGRARTGAGALHPHPARLGLGARHPPRLRRRGPPHLGTAGRLARPAGHLEHDQGALRVSDTAAITCKPTAAYSQAFALFHKGDPSTSHVIVPRALNDIDSGGL